MADERTYMLRVKASEREGAMMQALAEANGVTVSEMVRGMVRSEYRRRFDTALPIDDGGTSYVWRTTDTGYRLYPARDPDQLLAQADRQPSGKFVITGTWLRTDRAMVRRLGEAIGLEFR